MKTATKESNKTQIFLWDKIVSNKMLKSDPIEWSARWEEVVDSADQIVYAKLADMPRGLGFCHSFWPARREVLKKKFGLDWKSPAMMNPRVMFD